jgi:formate hydrogenlyase transcriptional activator
MDKQPALPIGILRAGDEHDDEMAVLRALVEGTARNTGEEFFQSLVRHLATAVGTRYAFVAEFAGPMRARTLAYWQNDRIAPNFEWDLAGTPCEEVVRGALCHYPADIRERFPADQSIVELGVQSYLGVPLSDAQGRHLGHLAVFDDRPMPDEPRRLAIFRIFAARAAAELERLRFDKELAESERRYRDLYEEAPIAYIYEDLESRFVRANRAACNLLGVRPEEVTSTYGVTLLAPVPQTQERIREALHAMKHDGREFAAVELELRRKDDGQSIWVQWWSKPEPDGRHTRTMLVDITRRVLMEREKARLEQQNLYLQEEIKSVHNFEEIVGRSASLQAVLDHVRRVAPTDATVLITGETGTGKELFARAIHSHSSRRDKPLIKVNCAALPTGLVESELFGHERGAFSGAISRRVGRFELASGGTIFLDEIGEVPLEVQVKLLRVLQEREFERVGGSAPIRTDVRVIAATNRKLQEAVKAGMFREDLFYRLSVFPVHLPPLRDRRDDLPLLVQFLVSKFASRIGKTIHGVSRDTMARIMDYPWPGNVRELENILERAVILSNAFMLEIDADVFAAVARPQPPPTAVINTIPRLGALQDVERAHVLSVLKQTNWIIEGPRGAAKVLNLHPNTLRSRLKRLGLARGAHEAS